jgi:hypothetical protein
MGYAMASGRWADTISVDLNTAAGRVPDGTTATGVTKTATYTSPWVELGDLDMLRLQLNVTAASGTTPTLDVAIQTSYDAGVTDAARAVASFAQKTAVSAERKAFVGLDRYVRFVATIGGTTPSFTFTVSGEGVN